MIKILCLILFLLISSFSRYFTFSDKNSSLQARYGEFDKIRVIVLSGNKREMGLQYGKLMKSEMLINLIILKDFFVALNGIPYEKLINRSNAFFETFDKSYQIFIESIAEGSDGLLTLDDVKVLNAQETLIELIFSKTSDFACSFLFIPSFKTITGGSLIGRFYDYYPPFDKIAHLLTLVVLKENDKLASAIVGFPGQIYCPTCINSRGVFMEINNGAIYCQKAEIKTGVSILNKLLLNVQESEDLLSINRSLNRAFSNYCLIVNVANKDQVLNLEFNRSVEMHSDFPKIPFVSTNFFLNPAWGDIHPTDADTWNGVTRRENLLKLISKENNFDISKFKRIMDIHILEGGATWAYTIYQIIFDSNTYDLYLKITANPKSSWTKINLNSYLSKNKNDKSENMEIISMITIMSGVILTAVILIFLFYFIIRYRTYRLRAHYTEFQEK